MSVSEDAGRLIERLLADLTPEQREELAKEMAMREAEASAGMAGDE